MKAVTRAGLRVPEDIAIIGFDDSYISRVVEPELTTVRIDAAKMGCLAMQTLFDLIAGDAGRKGAYSNSYGAYSAGNCLMLCRNLTRS